MDAKKNIEDMSKSIMSSIKACEESGNFQYLSQLVMTELTLIDAAGRTSNKATTIAINKQDEKV